MRFLLPLVAFGLSGCLAVVPADGGSSGSGFDDNLGGDPNVAEQFDDVGFLALVNDERGNATVAAVTLNAELSEAAQLHAEDMVANDYFDHIGLDGSEPGDRVTEAGYDWATVAENIAQAPTDELAIQVWNDSPAHQEAMLDGTYVDAGVGHDGDLYVLVLATPQ